MKVGTVYSSIVLDRDSRIYSGSEDPVTGNVVIEFKAWDREKGETVTTELFGPLRIHLTFEGEIRTKIDEDYVNRASHREYEDSRQLFQETFLAYDGQLRAGVGEKMHFPFRIFFPKRALPTVKQRMSKLEEQNCDLLPPAFETEFVGDYGGGQGSVEYRLKAEVEVIGIEVDVATNGVPPSLRYQPSISDIKLKPTKSTSDQAFTVYDESFISESERPHGFRAKAKAMLNDVEPPCYAFDLIWADVPDCIYPSQSISFKVAIRANADLTTTTATPEILLQECKLTISGHCGVRAWPKLQPMIESAEVKDIEDAAVVFGTVQPDGPFSKENDYTKAITTQTLPYLPCSFAVERMSRYYKAWFHLILQVGGQKVNAKRMFPITVLPPMQDGKSHDFESMQAGSSQSFEENEEQLPAYE